MSDDNGVDLVKEAYKMRAEWEKLYKEAVFRAMKVGQAMIDFDRELEELVNGTGNSSD